MCFSFDDGGTENIFIGDLSRDKVVEDTLQ